MESVWEKKSVMRGRIGRSIQDGLDVYVACLRHSNEQSNVDIRGVHRGDLWLLGLWVFAAAKVEVVHFHGAGALAVKWI